MIRTLLIAPALAFAAYTGLMSTWHISEYARPVEQWQYCYAWRIAGEPAVVGGTTAQVDAYCKSLHE